MPISKRTLTKWRKEALKAKDTFETRNVQSMSRDGALLFSEHIIALTAELLDQQLLKEK